MLEWRYDEDYPEDLKLTADELGQETDGGFVSFPFKLIVDELIDLGVTFQEPEKKMRE